MNFDEADKIVYIWGRHLEFAHGRLLAFFFGKIPESFLPYPKDTLLKALNIIVKHHHDNNNPQGENAIREAAGSLIIYTSDKEGIDEVLKQLNDPKWRKLLEELLPKMQKSWIEEAAPNVK